VERCQTLATIKTKNMGLNKVYGIKPEENTCSDLVPLEYFYQAIADIKRIQSLLDEGKYDVGRQPLLVYLDIYLMFAKKYPNMASETVGKLKRKSLKETFDSWWERNEHKIPKKYRIGIRQSADDLFDEKSESRKDIAKFTTFRAGSGLVKQALSRLSRMMGNYHVRFLGGKAPEREPTYPITD
jgi:hypothetical protein